MPDSLEPIILKNLFGPQADLDALDWRPFHKGIDIVRIYGDGRTGPAAALLRYAAGASVPLHLHRDYEHVVILRQGQDDAKGSYRAGTLVVNKPGSLHDVKSPGGCVVLIIWNKPVEFL
jgi:anti-sigma factor ChrR (cupin superfamily)